MGDAKGVGIKLGRIFAVSLGQGPKRLEAELESAVITETRAGVGAGETEVRAIDNVRRVRTPWCVRGLVDEAAMRLSVRKTDREHLTGLHTVNADGWVTVHDRWAVTP